MARLNTKLESKGARFLVLGQMLIRGIDTSMPFEKMSGYDLVATHSDNRLSARIQVRSRWRTDAPKFNVTNLACDFVVVVKLNRGSKDGTAKVLTPEYFVFPIAVIERAPRLSGNVHFDQFRNLEDYRNQWNLIGNFLDEGE
ncbi:MAG: hypothetical protein OXP71_07320 [Candidatus Poribacteria bacterium]|nr:hypothetical protein [Candidatus Poribacteria bacterium]